MLSILLFNLHTYIHTYYGILTFFIEFVGLQGTLLQKSPDYRGSVAVLYNPTNSIIRHRLAKRFPDYRGSTVVYT